MCLIRESPSIGHHVLVLGEAGEMSEEFTAAVTGIRHAAVLGGGFSAIVRVVRETLPGTRPDGVIIWHGMVALPEILHALCHYKGRILVHGGNPASHSRLVDGFYWVREKWLGRRACPLYVCCSRHVSDSFRRSFYLRRFERTVVPNGVTPPTIEPHAPRPIAAGDTFTLGMVARLDHIKDHPALLRAFALILKEWPSARLELVGDGERRAELESLSGELGISEQVRFAGSVPDPYLMMRDWDLFAYTTTEREGLGNALLEALTFGLPCVAPERGPVREILEETQSGILVPPGNPEALAQAVMALALNFQQRQDLSAQGRRRATERFSASRFAREYLSLAGAVSDS
jgi:glycosyltransferase involved in cell wall biosynthesis